MGLYRREGSQFYWMTFTVDGRKVFESTKTSNKKLAEKIYSKRVTDIVEGKWFDTASKKRTLKEMIERYASDYSSKKKYQSRDRIIFSHLTAYFGENRRLQDIQKTIGGYEAYRAVKVMPATVVKELGLLRRMFNIAMKKWRWVRENPVSTIEIPKVNNERVRYLSAEELNSLLNVLDGAECPQWLKPIVIIALNTGLRKANVLGLQWTEVNLFSRLVVIEGTQMKNKESIGIPLTHEAFQTLMTLQRMRRMDTSLVFLDDNGKKIYPVKLHRALRKACKLAGISDFRFHDARHTFASYLRQRGVDLHTISKLLGHKDMRMTQRYSHLSVEHLRSAIETLDTRVKGYNLLTFGEEKGAANL